MVSINVSPRHLHPWSLISILFYACHNTIKILSLNIKTIHASDYITKKRLSIIDHEGREQAILSRNGNSTQVQYIMILLSLLMYLYMYIFGFNSPI